MKKFAKLCITFLSLCSLATIANAATTGAYMGAGLGASRLETADNYLFTDRSYLSQSKERGGLGERFFGGYNFNQYVGLEAGLAHYAPSKYSTTNIFNGADENVKYELNAFDVVGKGYLPIGESGFNLYALAGLALVHSKLSANASYRNVNLSGSKIQNRIRPTYGVGASYDIPNSSLTTSLEWSRIQGMGNTSIHNGQGSDSAIPNADMLSLNLAYNFG